MQLITQKSAQLNNKLADKKVSNKNLKLLLSTATCALLSSNATQAAEPTEDTWKFDTALMYYGETDRVSAAEAIVAGTKTYSDDKILSLKLTLDALTGASANGAVAQKNVQTFTRPSGNGTYNVAAGETPLDDTFHDTRLQFTGQWTQPLAEDYTLSVGGNFSKEYDYLSLSGNANLARDFNNKNTTVSAGFSFAADQIDPEGGIPKPLVEAYQAGADNLADTRLDSGDSKTTADLLFGVTQVINRRMITQFNYSYSKADGYLTDPFKVLSVVNDQGQTQRLLNESRPDSRTKHSFYAQAKYHFDNSVLDASYRYMTDDWKIDSHTFDTRLRLPMGSNNYIEPHFRYYTQSAAEFYQPFMLESDPLPTFASADYRIGEMDAYTIGVKYGIPLENNQLLAFRLEYYKQSPKSDGTPAIGDLADVELYKEINALILQVSYSF